MKVDFENMQYEVVQEKYLPYPIKGKLREMSETDKIMTASEMTQ